MDDVTTNVGIFQPEVFACTRACLANYEDNSISKHVMAET